MVGTDKFNAYIQSADRTKEETEDLFSSTSGVAASLEEAVFVARHEQIIKFRRHIKNTLLGLLTMEIIFVGVLICLQGFSLAGFNLNPWVLGTFINGVLLQTFFSVRIIVKSLFRDDD